MDLGPLTPQSTVVDWWVFRKGTRDAVHLTVKPAGARRDGRVDAYVFRILGSLWTAQNQPVPDVGKVGHRFIVVQPLDAAREVARHLARAYADGSLPEWPTTPVERMSWAASCAIAEVFVERFGTLDAALREV